MARKLDRTRPFGEIYGGSGDARYEQHGIMFDAAGDELPGYDDVEIPEPKEVVIVQGDDTALRAEIARLTSRLEAALTQLEDADGELEGVQGQLDSANVEISRLNDEVARLSALVPVDGVTTVGSEEVSLDSQLDLQTAGMTGKKK